MFRCSNPTYEDCMKLKLFGQTESMKSYVEKVRKGDILFLNNVNNFIEGPFYAISDGGHNIIPGAWKGRFPWQVRFKTIDEPRRIHKNDYYNFMGIPSFGDAFYDFEISQKKGDKLLEALGIALLNENEPLANLNNSSIQENNDRSKFHSSYRCDDGHYVKSLSEVLIDNWLYGHNIPHAYEPLVPIKETIWCDFYIKPISLYIEFWGRNDAAYLKKKGIKLALYKANNLNVLNLESNHVLNLDDILTNKLRQAGLDIK